VVSFTLPPLYHLGKALRYLSDGKLGRSQSQQQKLKEI
jgi:hypothetical protein